MLPPIFLFYKLKVINFQYYINQISGNFKHVTQGFQRVKMLTGDTNNKENRKLIWRKQKNSLKEWSQELRLFWHHYHRNNYLETV